MLRYRLPAAIAAFALIALTAAGCAKQQGAEAPSARPAETAASIEAMTADQKRSLIATSFPLEVPVPAGDVRRGQAQGTDAWDYEVDIDAPVSAVDAWFQAAYRARNWQLSERTPTEDGVSLTFVKAVAQTGVVLSENGEGTTAVVVLGLGTPVLQTQ